MGMRWNNLSFRLPAFILLVSLIPLGGFGLFSIDYSEQVLLETQARATRRTTMMAANLVEMELDEVIKDLMTDAENLDLLALPTEDLEWALLTILRQHDMIKEVTLIDPAGNELVRVSVDQVFLPEELSDQSDNPAVIEALNGNSLISQPQIHRDEHGNGGYLSHVSVPLVDPASQSVAAVLLIDLALREAFAKITDLRIGQSGSLYILDGHGRLLAHVDPSLVLAEAILPLETLRAASDVNKDGGVKYFRNISDVEVQAAMAPVRGTDWYVVGERPMAGILDDLQQQSQLFRILLAGTVLLLLPIIFFFFRRTVVPLQLLEQGAEEIGRGQFGRTIPVHSDDEIGRVSSAFNAMSGNLRQMTADREQVSWQEKGMKGLDAELRGLFDGKEIARKACTYLARYVEAPVAALYVASGKDMYRLAAGFSNQVSNPVKQEFQLGQGLVGQVAAQRQTLELNELPEHYLDVTSALGSADSNYLIVLPLQHNEQVLAVLELGAFEPFSEQAKVFLHKACDPLAVALNSANAARQLSEALKSSQQFSEELQTQQEELQAANEELEEQSQRLRASEEELQTQHEELQAANEELEEKTISLEEQQQALSLKNEVLQGTQERLEQHARDLQVASKYKSEFLANMSHELRTPLNSLLILSQDLASNGDGNLLPGQVESAEVIYGSGNDLLRLINEILDLSKIEAGKMDLDIDQIMMENLQENLRKKFQHMAEAKGVAFEIAVAEDAPPELQSDSQRLIQILNNLLSNALKFTTAGKVTLSVGRPVEDIDLMRSDLETQSCCAISVSDTGIGIAEDKLEEIFGAFQQVDGSISRQFGGTGLGLTISRELANLLGGELQVESVLGEGSTFTLYLPVNYEKQPRSAVVASARPARKKPASKSAKQQQPQIAAPSLADDREKLSSDDRVILIVEDDLKFARILMDLCHGKDYLCLHAGDGETGLKLVEDFLPTAILLDIRLPGMHGLELLEVLKSRSDLRHIPVHLLSVEDRAHEALHLGAAGFLSKPANKEELVSVLERLDDITSGRLRRLLVVEDSAEQRRSIVQLIGNGDVETVEAASAAEALKHLEGGTIDCMILDLGLPDMNGLEFLASLGSLDIQPPPVIIYTGKELSREEEEALNEYSASIIIKGIKSPERLLDEASLFLHRMVAKLPSHKQQMIAELHDGDEIFRGQKILLVDDDMRNVFALSKVLEQKGLSVIKAANGEKALEMLDKQDDIDLVLMDIMMPVMDGYEATRRIRAQPRFAKLPILALTAKAMQEDRGKCIEAGANDYLSKPVDIAKLLSLLRVWLGR